MLLVIILRVPPDSRPSLGAEPEFAARVPDMAERLNDLDGAAWVSHSTTLIESRPGPRSKLKKSHPATFSEQDAARLVRFFTRRGGLVLDPFAGTGSTALACAAEGRRSLGFELYPEWADLARRRIVEELPVGADSDVHEIRTGDALAAYGSLDDGSIDFLLTSPPYWSILKKIDKLVRETRVDEGLAHEYGGDAADVGRERSYTEYLDDLAQHAAAWRRLLRPGRYACVLVGDFRHGPNFHMLHADVAALLDRAGLTSSGLFVIAQRNRPAMPYGYPTAFVPQAAHMFVVVARRSPGVR